MWRWHSGVWSKHGPDLLMVALEKVRTFPTESNTLQPSWTVERLQANRARCKELTMTPFHMTLDQLGKSIADNEVLIQDFWATWCARIF